MTGGNRAPWPSGTLRRQKSCVDGFLLAATVRGRSEKSSNLLQRQFSVDQDMRHCQSNSIRDDSRNTEANFRNKKRQSTTNPENVPKYEQHQVNNTDLSERLKKALNRRDNRINLNIVLTQVSNIPEPEAINASDSESQSNELVQASVDSKASKEVQEMSPGETKGVLKQNAARPLGRGQRPPLVRAMSAPIRTTADPAQNRRKNPRRRKFGRDREENLLMSSRKSLERQDAITSDTSPSRSTKSCERKGSSGISGGTRSAIGCDIVTLVSLLSSGGSDSEREDNGQPTTGKPEKSVVRPPSLKKTGKSVSFQDNDTSTFPPPSKDFSTMFRRGSVAPLAARIRSNRPPTAPPGSIFITDYDKGCGDDAMSLKKQPVNTAKNTFTKVTSKAIIEDKCNSIDTEDDSPDNLKTAKERECWKLFQKMTNRGISVSYDTILRGMLTPTELRMIQKKQELENAKRNSMEESQAPNKTSSSGSAIGASLSATQNRDKIKNISK